MMRRWLWPSVALALVIAYPLLFSTPFQRQPASFCGVVGLMPTYGRVSRYGLIAFASSLDHIGRLAKTVKDAAIVLGTIAGRDPMDSTSAELAVPDYVAELDKPVRGMKIGVAKEYLC